MFNYGNFDTIKIIFIVYSYQVTSIQVENKLYIFAVNVVRNLGIFIYLFIYISHTDIWSNYNNIIVHD